MPGKEKMKKKRPVVDVPELKLHCQILSDRETENLTDTKTSKEPWK